MGTLVDPYQITDYTRDDESLQAMFLFCCAVANKKASSIAPKVHAFLDGYPGNDMPFEKIKRMVADGTLEDNLRRVRMGKYSLLTQGYPQVASYPTDFLRTASLDDLMKIKGVGHKTGRFFLLHNRSSADHAVVDTHMLKFLRDVGEKGVPAKSPSDHSYPILEKMVLSHAGRLGMTPAEFDIRTWRWYEAGNRGVPDFVSMP